MRTLDHYVPSLDEAGFGQFAEKSRDFLESRFQATRGPNIQLPALSATAPAPQPGRPPRSKSPAMNVREPCSGSRAIDYRGRCPIELGPPILDDARMAGYGSQRWFIAPPQSFRSRK
jgi:hypothetical protein